MDTDVISVLDEKFNTIMNEEKGLRRLETGFTFLTDFVRRFFSANGEAEGIRNMYKVVETNPTKEIICSDVYSIGNIYEEYIEGMMSFINDINSLNIDNSSDVLNNFRDKFNKAKENDGKFIDALFSGDITQKKSMNLENGSVNIEYLINLIPYMEIMISKCKGINNGLLNSTSKEKIDLVNECCNLLYDSILKYCVVMVKEIIHTYKEISNCCNEVVKQPETKFVLY